MNILITGATGFIGGAIAKRLYGHGDTLVTIRRDKIGAQPHHIDVVVEGDILDFDTVRRTISDYQIDQVYHLAAQSIVSVCAQDPVSAYKTTVMGTVNLLESIRQVGSRVKSIVVSTSDKVYGHAPAPYSEDTEFKPKFTYESTKACQDIAARNYFYNYGLPVKILRCSNVYGPGDPNKSRLIPRSIARIHEGKSPIVYTTSRDHVREFVFIDDAVDAFMLVQNQCRMGEIFCVGGTEKAKIVDVILAITTIMESNIPIVYREKEEDGFWEIQEQWIDASKLKSSGWEPKVSLLDGLRKTVEEFSTRSHHEHKT